LSEARIGFARESARSIIRRLRIIGPPVDVQAIAKNEQLEVEVIASWPDQVSGLLLREARLIGVNGNHNRRRQRFSLAHELGHWFMRHDFEWREASITMDRPPEDDTTPDNADESEADEFAGELLVPLAFLKTAFRTNGDIAVLAELFDVSEEAMWVRVLRHRLI